MSVITRLVSFVAIVLLGLNAGFFYTWSFTVMQALDLIPAGHAISAMQSINANIRSAWFGTVFFGAPLASLLALVLLMTTGRKTASVLAALALLAAIANVVITMQWHVPWNDALGLLQGASAPENPAAVWQTYSQQWTAANHWRTGVSLAAFIMMLGAMLAARRRG